MITQSKEFWRCLEKKKMTAMGSISLPMSVSKRAFFPSHMPGSPGLVGMRTEAAETASLTPSAFAQTDSDFTSGLARFSPGNDRFWKPDRSNIIWFGSILVTRDILLDLGKFAICSQDSPSWLRAFRAISRTDGP